MASQLLGYVERNGALQKLAATSKLLMVIALVVAAMITFDVRLLVVLTVINMVLWAVSRIKLRDLKVVLGIITVFMVLNNLLIFAFAPDYGTNLFGTRHVLLDGFSRWDITSEQLFYQLLVTLKYFAVLPGVLLFITTTRPPEFASSLNSIGVPYRFAYSVALALRYIPDVQRDFTTISQAQQARGLDASRKAKIRQRLRNLLAVLMPLLLGSLDRIDTVAAAMELRGFGRDRKRTWYTGRSLRRADWAFIALGVVIVVVAIMLYVLNGSRFWNPFI